MIIFYLIGIGVYIYLFYLGWFLAKNYCESKRIDRDSYDIVGTGGHSPSILESDPVEPKHLIPFGRIWSGK